MSTSKNRILDAAERIVLRDGPGHLTLDAVAAETSLSKGGVLYHFATKDDLIRGMITRLIDQFEGEMAQLLEQDTDPAGRQTRAYLNALVDPPVAPPEQSERICAALLAAAAHNPSLLEPVQDRVRSWQTRMVEDGLDPVMATIIRLACDGLWMTELLRLPPLDPKLRDQVIARLRLSTKGS